MIQDQALIVKRDLGIDDNFKASKGWCTRFMRRNNYSIRRPTKIAQKLPHHFVDKICKFQRFVIRRRGAVNYELRHIANMDETPLCMDMVSGSTVSKKGKKTVLMKSTGHEKSRYTVVLAVTADGNKLPPMIIYRRKTKPPGNFPSGVVIHWNAKGWMDEEACNIWIQKVWQERPGALLKKKALLVWDHFAAHLTSGIKAKVKSTQTDMAIIQARKNPIARLPGVARKGRGATPKKSSIPRRVAGPKRGDSWLFSASN